jgi:hypothetical protein
MKDPLDVEIKFKKGSNGQVICYSDDAPGVEGAGANEAAASNHFWKHFNTAQEKEESTARNKRHAAAAATAAPAAGGKKKAA